MYSEEGGAMNFFSTILFLIWVLCFGTFVKAGDGIYERFFDGWSWVTKISYLLSTYDTLPRTSHDTKRDTDAFTKSHLASPSLT